MANIKNTRKQSNRFSDKPRVETVSRTSQHLTPYFSFQNMQNNTGFRVKDCDTPNKAALADKLFELSQVSWATIVSSPRTSGTGTETIPREQIKAPLNHITEDVTFLVFHISQKCRLVGYSEDRVFHILFIDPNHKLY